MVTGTMNVMLGIVEGMREIRAHKMRSALTIGSVALGVASLMAMFAITAGIGASFRGYLQSIGGVERVVLQDADVPEDQELIKDMSPGRTYRDITAIRQSAPLVKWVSADQRINGDVAVRWKDKVFRTNNVRGIEADYFKIEKLGLVSGRMITDLDVEKGLPVLVLGRDACDDLFAGNAEEAIGCRVLMNSQVFTVIGVLLEPNRGWRSGRLLIPFTTMQWMFNSAQVDAKGVDAGPVTKISEIKLTVLDVKHFDAALEQVRNVLNITHKGIQDFGFQTREDWFDMIEGSVRGVEVSGGLVAMVGLLVGGVGIANVALASLKERTREMGIRQAVGATGMDLFVQVALEAMVLAALGAAVGIACGYGFIWFLDTALPTDQPRILEFSAIVISFGAAMAVGLAAGLFPAFRAYHMNPIDALRYE